METTKYYVHPNFELTDRKWPNQQIQQAPRWCSLDLYLGQQSLLHPMSIIQKIDLFSTLVKLGFKEISISNPGREEKNFAFLKRLINENLIPDDVSIQVTLPCHSEVIKKSIPLLKGVKKLIIQLEVPCSETFSQLTFDAPIKDLNAHTLESANCLHDAITHQLSDSKVQYSISFEDFIVADKSNLMLLANQLAEQWLQFQSQLIIHLPNTMDYKTASFYADGVEWFIKNFAHSDKVIFSTFSKNNRGNAVACCELALQAGATRVEGSLLGIGERAGNNDLITMILNLQSLNIQSDIVIDDINQLVETLQATCSIKPPNRHPYAGDLCFTALSPFQQEIIYKGLKQFENSAEKIWQVPYLNLNPADVGRVYESVSYQLGDETKELFNNILANHFGFNLPELLSAEFSHYAQELFSDKKDSVEPVEVKNAFMQFYANIHKPITLKSINFEKASLTTENDLLHCDAVVEYKDKKLEISGSGDGAIDTLINAFATTLDLQLDVASFYQHALTQGSSALAATYIKIVTKDAKGFWGLGIDGDSTLSSIKAFFNALNRSQLAAE